MNIFVEVKIVLIDHDRPDKKKNPWTILMVQTKLKFGHPRRLFVFLLLFFFSSVFLWRTLYGGIMFSSH